jgi:hypothetical protein
MKCKHNQDVKSTWCEVYNSRRKLTPIRRESTKRFYRIETTTVKLSWEEHPKGVEIDLELALEKVLHR